MAIPFIDLKSQYETLKEQIDARIHAVLEHGQFIMGPEVRELEEKLAEYVGVKHAVGCASGTDALLLPLMALGVGPGDAVFTTPFTFIATAEVISLLGATPVFVDIDPVTYNIDPSQLALAIRALETKDPSIHPLPADHASLNARGVIAVDLYGLPADYDRIQNTCSDHALFLIEDAAQSFGAEYKGRRACSFGDVGATSFFPAKPLGCYGDGGMVFTNRDEIADKMRSIRVHGKGNDKYDNMRVGLNARLDTLQAAILLAKFETFPEELRRRQEVAWAYTEALVGADGIVAPHVPEDLLSGWAQYTLRITGRDRADLQKAFQAQGVPTAVYYPKPLHLQTAFSPLGYHQEDFPESEQASTEVLSLPFGPYLSKEGALNVARKAMNGE